VAAVDAELLELLELLKLPDFNGRVDGREMWLIDCNSRQGLMGLDRRRFLD
jgi:hypothetical protein